MLHNLMPFFVGASSGVVTLTNYNHSVSAPNSAFTGAQYGCFTDGRCYSGAGRATFTSAVARNTSTDWIIPNSAANAGYQVKIEEVSVTGTDTTPAYYNDAGSGKRLSTWVALTTDRWWGTVADNPSTITTWNITMHIRYGTGPEIDSCNISLTNNNLG